jgi:hypothetical protein
MDDSVRVPFLVQKNSQFQPQQATTGLPPQLAKIGLAGDPGAAGIALPVSKLKTAVYVAVPQAAFPAIKCAT